MISAIFRRSTDSLFILEELQGIYDPNGGTYKDGKYYISFYAEIGEVIERFFYDVKIIDKSNPAPIADNGMMEEVPIVDTVELNNGFRICPTCSSKSLKTENGCDSCMSCGYSKCDK